MFLAIFILFLIESKSNQNNQGDNALSVKKVSEEDLKIQKRVAKEIENFLNYNGEIQDDI